jgi:SNF2 family DNA or RNA helicase
MRSNGTRSKAFKKVRKNVKKVIGLSGTPAANSYLALFYQYLALDGGATFGTAVTRFRERFFVNRGYNFPDWKIHEEKGLLEYLKPSMLTMRAKDYLKELPQVVTSPHYFDLSPFGRAQYNEMQDDSVVEAADVLAGSAAVQSNKLRQLVSGFVYDDEAQAHFNGKDKLETFASLLDEIGDEQVLVFYGFKAEAVQLKQWCVPLGSHTINEWNNNREKRMMAHPASAGHGLNLQKSGAHHIVFFSLPWDAESYLQSIGRLLRSGNKAQTVFVHNLLANNTIDTKVVKTLNEKLNRHNRLMGQ